MTTFVGSLQQLFKNYFSFLYSLLKWKRKYEHFLLNKVITFVSKSIHCTCNSEHKKNSNRENFLLCAKICTFFSHVLKKFSFFQNLRRYWLMAILFRRYSDVCWVIDILYLKLIWPPFCLINYKKNVGYHRGGLL